MKSLLKTLTKTCLVSLTLTTASTFAADAPSATTTVKETAPTVAKSTQVVFETTRGNVTLDLYQDKAPQTVDNFLVYVDSGFYNDTIFHRVIPGFVVQGGGFTQQMKQKKTNDPVQNESDNMVKNHRATLSMARLPSPHSATSQFFINLNNNHNLDYRGGRHGYAVFAIVSDGMHVVDDIARQPTGNLGRYSDVPLEPIKIIKAYKVTESAPKTETPADDVSAPAPKPANKVYTAQ